MVARTPGTARGAQLFENMVHNVAAPANGATRAMRRRAHRRSARTDALRTAISMAPTRAYFRGIQAPASLKRRGGDGIALRSGAPIAINGRCAPGYLVGDVYRSTGNPASCQALKPPASDSTLR